MDKRTGLGTFQAGVLRPTVPRDEPADATDATPDDGEPGRGADGAAEPKVTRPRRKRLPAGGKVTPRKISMPDALYRRLELTAVDKNTTVSAVAVDILDRYAPEWDLIKRP